MVFYAQPKGAYCSLKSSILSLLDCFPSGNHGNPKENNQARSACMLLKSFILTADRMIVTDSPANKNYVFVRHKANASHVTMQALRTLL